MEVLTPHVPMIVCPRPFSLEGRQTKQLRPGMSIADMLWEFDLNPETLPARVFIDDCLVEKAYWHCVKPKANHLVSVRVIPEGGNNQSKDILRIVAMVGVLALAIAAPYAAGALGYGLLSAGTLGGSLLTAGIGIAGSLAVSALIPPATPNIPQLGGMNLDRSPALSITGTQNQMNLYGVVPKVLGRMRLFPPYAAEPYTEIVGNDQYLRCLFCLGYGPLLISDLRIGEDPIENFEDVEIEVRSVGDEPYELYSSDVHEDALSLPLTKEDGWQQRTSQPNVDELSVDISAPQGIYRINDEGNADPLAIYIRIEYRPVGSTDADWLLAGPLGFYEGAEFSVPGNPQAFDGFSFGSQAYGNTKPVRRGLRWKPVQGRGQYEIRIRRNPEDSQYIINELYARYNALPTPQRSQYFGGGFLIYSPKQLGIMAEIQWQEYYAQVVATTPSNRIIDQCFWTCLRSIKQQVPVRLPGLCTVALRIRNSNQLNGVIQSFNCIAHSIRREWNGFDWVPVPTSNPAALYRDLFQGRATAIQLPDGRMNLTQLQEWSEANQAEGRECNMIVDYQMTVREEAQLIAATGWASIHNQDGKYTVIRDVLQTDPVQMFTPRNSWGFKGSKTFIDIPHALKITFVNEEKNWTKDELIVYVDGYNADGSGGLIGASKFDTLDLVGVTNADRVYKDGRRHLAQAILRPGTYELNADFENLRCTRGDVVGVTHDVTLWGLGSGRILAVAVDGSSNATGATLDRPFVMSADLRYAIRYRREDGRQIEQEVVAVEGEQYSVAFTELIPAVDAPMVGDLFGYGEVDQVYTRLVIKSITRRGDFDATLTMLDEAPAIHDVDNGPLPPFDPRITIPLPLRKPLKPIIDEIISDERALIRDPDGSFRSRILIRLHFVSGLTPAARVEVRYKRKGSTESWAQTSAQVEGDADEIEMTHVHDLYFYDIMIRAVSRYNVPSEWVFVDGYQVVSKSLPPPNVGTLTLQDDRLTWSYPAPPADWLGFLVRVQVGDRTSWSDAIPLHDGVVTDSHFTLPSDSGIRTYLVKAVDTSRYESPTAASLYIDWGNRLVENVVESIDYQALGWPGMITGGGIVLDNIEANASTPYWTNDATQFWGNNSDLFWGALSEELTYVFAYTPPENLLSGTLFLETTVE